MDNDLTSQRILCGILAGNDTLERWTGGQWVCERGNCEYFLVSGVGEHLLTSMPGWIIWPETQAKDDFEWVDTNYREYVRDCDPREVFGGVRYDLALLRSPKTISGLIEIKRSWTREDLTKLARALFYLGIKPQRVRSGGRKGVLLESVFFGAFVWHKSNDPNANESLEAQYRKIKTDIETWWQEATTGRGDPVQAKFQTDYAICPQPKISYSSKVGVGKKAQ